MVTGMHVVLFSRHAEKVREFLGDVLGLRSVDAGGGWPIFAAPPAELAVHPADGEPGHEVFLMCDDVNAVVARLAESGIQTAGERIGLYQPRHASPLAT